jgi:hypothetical protein
LITTRRTLFGHLVRSGAGDHEINHLRRRTTMRKLIESILVSLDGVVVAPERWATFDAEAKLKEGVVIAPPWAGPVPGSGGRCGPAANTVGS